jgi:transcriptional regulator with XRE-family HTH domain
MSEQMNDWLQQRLAKSGLETLSALAIKSNISKGTLSKYFRGIQRPSIDVIEPLSKALKVTPTQLLIGLEAIKGKSK